MPWKLNLPSKYSISTPITKKKKITARFLLCSFMALKLFFYKSSCFPIEYLNSLWISLQVFCCQAKEISCGLKAAYDLWWAERAAYIFVWPLGCTLIIINSIEKLLRKSLRIRSRKENHLVFWKYNVTNKIFRALLILLHILLK